ncbi:MAG TPA: flagellar basal body P-ring formation chaperone FlgA [Steroidobacter sp.]|nr:flagellar basal body P-ring formation chaperone FlgA [Steroidobacter sp.]
MRVSSPADSLNQRRTPAAPLLWSAALLIALLAADASPRAAQNVQALVVEAARERLSERAQRAGLANPSFEIEVAPRGDAPTGETCAQRVTVEIVSDAHPSRMRLDAVCNAAPGWRTEYVVRAAIFADAVVAVADAPANQPILPEQLAVRRRELSGAQQALSSIEEVAGLISRRALRRGQLVDARWLIQPLLVRRGERVDIVARNAGVQVNVAAEAMEDARRGELVRVRNLASGKIIRARVIGEGMVEPIDIPMSSASQ